MRLRACDVTVGHLGQRVSVDCDGFGASGVLRGVVGYETSRSVVMHLADSGATGTVTVPWNADVEISGPEASGVAWAEEVA